MPLLESISGLPESDRAALVASLNLRLAEGLDLLLALYGAHWRTKGHLFEPIHVGTLKPLYEDVFDYCDMIAECIAALGGTPVSSAAEIAAGDRPQPALEPGKTYTGPELVAIVAQRFRNWLAMLNVTLGEAKRRKDEVTFDLLIEVMRGVRKSGAQLYHTLTMIAGEPAGRDFKVHLTPTPETGAGS